MAACNRAIPAHLDHMAGRMMNRPRAIHQIMPAFLYADALGNQAQCIRAQLRHWGYDSQVYALIRDRRWANPGLDFAQYRSRADQIAIFHYSIGSPLTAQVQALSDRVVPYYHNVTPPEFLRGYNPERRGCSIKGGVSWPCSSRALRVGSFRIQPTRDAGTRFCASGRVALLCDL